MTSQRKTDEKNGDERLAESDRVQQQLCDRYGVPFFPSPGYLKVGLAQNVSTPGLKPLNGLRHPPEGETTGWYIWAGEVFGTAHDFFQPVHVIHLLDDCPQALKYLGLPPGWRFLTADDYEDIWYDASLLQV